MQLRWALATLALSALSARSARAEPDDMAVSCSSGTLSVSTSDDWVVVTCDSSGDTDSVELDATTGVNVVVNDITSDLTVEIGSILDYEVLSITAGNGTVAPLIDFGSDLPESTTLYSLSLDGVYFDASDVTLSFPTTLESLSVVGSNAVDIGFKTYSSLQNLTLGGSFSTIPRILYQVDYNSINDGKGFLFTPDADNFSITIDAVKLPGAYAENLMANIDDLSTIGIQCTEGDDGSTYTCSTSDGASSSGSQDSTESSGSSSSSSSDPTSSANSASTSKEGESSSSSSIDTSGGTDGGLSTAVIIIIVIVVAVALVALVFFVRCCRARRNAKATSSASGNTVALISSDQLAMRVGERQNDDSNLWEDETITSWRVPRNMVDIGPLISRGGYGEVFRGSYNGHDVAVKTLLPETRRSVKHVNAFLAEVKLMAVLEHARIVQFVGVAWNSFNDLCALSEFMSGGDLRALLLHFHETKHREGFDHDKVKIALHVAHALTYLHSLSPPVIHRDLKSKNVLLTPELDAKLTDFGVSRERVDHTMTAGVGTSLWMAPEIMTGARYNEAADMFSFGVLLSELDTQTLPYSRAKESGDLGRRLPDAAILHMVAMGSLRVDFSRVALREVVALGVACVSTDPKARPSAAEALYKLQTVLQRL